MSNVRPQVLQRRALSRVELGLWVLATSAFLGMVIWGTLDPWSVAEEKLASVGHGPYIPYAFFWSSNTVGDRTDVVRTQIYVVTSRALRSASTFEVREINGLAKVEELKFGLVYLAGALLLYIGGTVWQMRRHFKAGLGSGVGA